MNEFDYLKKAKDKMEKEKYHEVISLCNKALKINDDLSKAYSLRGDANYCLENYKQAIEDYSKSINKEPDNIKLYADRSWTYYKMENYEDAIVDINKVLETEPNTSLYYYEKGIYEYWLGRYKEAVYDFTKGIELKPTENKHIYRAWCYEKLEQYDLAFNDYNSALEINPESTDVYFYLGAFKRELGDYNCAIKYLEKGLEINPDDDELYLEIGKCRAEMGKLSGAMKYINKAVKLNPSKNNYASRILAREKALKIRQNIINMYNNKSLNDFDEDTVEIFNEKQAQDDIKDITKIFEISSDSIDTKLLLNRLDRYIYLKDYNKALCDINKLIELDEEEDSYYLKRAKINFELKNYADTIADCETHLKSAENMDDIIEILSIKGLSEFKLAQYEKCVEDLSKVLAFDENPELYYYRALANYNLKNYIFAFFDIKKAFELNNKAEFDFEDKMPKIMELILNLFKEKPEKETNNIIGLSGLKKII